MLGVAGEVKAPTYAELYSGDWVPVHVVGVWVNRIGKVDPFAGLRLEFGSLRHHALRHIPPQRYQQLTRHGDNGDALDLAALIADPFVGPSAQSAAWLMT